MKWETRENGTLLPMLVVKAENVRVVLRTVLVRDGAEKQYLPQVTVEDRKHDALGGDCWVSTSGEDRTTALEATIFNLTKEITKAEQGLKDILATSHPDDLEGKTLTELIEMVNLELNAEHERAGPL